MNQLMSLNAEYLALAEQDPERLRREYDEIAEYMKASSAIHHGDYVRTCFQPKLFTEEIFAGFSADMKLLYGIFEKVINAYFADSAYRKLFGYEARTEALILRANPKVSLLPMARIDLFYNEDTGSYKFCEFNTDGTSAMNEDRELNMAQTLSGCRKVFGATHTVRSCELFDSWVDTLCAVYRRARGTDKPPYVAIVDLMEFGTVSEFEVFAGRFVANGVPAEVCDARTLHYNAANRTLCGPSGHKIDAIYRRAVTSDILDHYEDCRDLLEAVREDAVVLVGDFHTQIVHNKTIFRVLHEEATQKLLTPAEQSYVATHVPITRAYRPQDAVMALANKDAWILKPLDSYGSRGVHAGVECTQSEWEEIVANTPGEGYLLQEFCMPYVTQNYGMAGERFGKNNYYNLTGIYVYDGVAQGVYSRVSLSPIISSQYSEKALPTLLVAE